MGSRKYILISLAVAAFLVVLWKVLFVRGDEPAPVEISPLTEQGCQISCWNDLRPSITSLNDVEDFLQNNESVDYSPTDLITQGDFTFYTSTFLEHISLQLLVYKDSLRRVALAGGFRLTLRQVIEEFGEPPFVFPKQERQPNSQIDTSASLFYPEYGYHFTFHLPRSDQGNICFGEEDETSLVQIFQEGSIEDLVLETELSITAEPDPEAEEYIELVDRIMRKLIPWPGFTCVEIVE